jgi:DNA-binding transcriptional MerR regulator
MAAHYAGLRSRMMLDYLERAGVFEREELRTTVRPYRRHGRWRKYTFRDIVVLRAISTLLDKGVSVQRIKDAMLSFSRDDKFACDLKSLTHSSEPIQYFVTDGNSIYFSRDNTLLDVVRGGQGAFSFVVDLQQASSEAGKTIPQSKLNARTG